MSSPQDMELEKAFLRLIQELDPKLASEEDVARELAGRLVNFANEWATGSEDLDSSERSLIDWLASGRSSTPRVDRERIRERIRELKARQKQLIGTEKRGRRRKKKLVSSRAQAANEDFKVGA